MSMPKREILVPVIKSQVPTDVIESAVSSVAHARRSEGLASFKVGDLIEVHQKSGRYHATANIFSGIVIAKTGVVFMVSKVRNTSNSVRYRHMPANVQVRSFRLNSPQIIRIKVKRRSSMHKFKFLF